METFVRRGKSRSLNAANNFNRRQGATAGQIREENLWILFRKCSNFYNTYEKTYGADKRHLNFPVENGFAHFKCLTGGLMQTNIASFIWRKLRNHLLATGRKLNFAKPHHSQKCVSVCCKISFTNCKGLGPLCSHYLQELVTIQLHS